MIKLLRGLRLLTAEEACKIEQSSIPVRTSAVINAGFAFAALALVAALASFWVGLRSAELLDQSPPAPRQPMTASSSAGNLPFLDEDGRDAFRAKVDHLQRQLEGLETRQSELQARLHDKTAEAKELSQVANNLQAELRVKEREINTLSELGLPSKQLGRQFSRGTTEYLSPIEAPGESPGFMEPQGASVRRATAAPEFPAELIIDVTPGDAQPGDPYCLSVQIYNRGYSSLDISSLDLIWMYEGRKTGGSIPIRAQRIDPKVKSLLHKVDGVWLEELHTATVVATATLTDGARLTNTLSW